MVRRRLDPLVRLVERAASESPSEFARIVAEEAASWSAREAAVYLIDYDRSRLVPMPSPFVADRGILSVNGTLAGRCFRAAAPQSTDGPAAGQTRLWLPLLDGTARLGVLEIVLDEGGDPTFDGWMHYARLVAELAVVRGLYGDVFEFVRRLRPMTLASEVQWRLAPPLSFENAAIAVAGALEPCYDVGGDVFDYAINGDLLHLALFDAMGHGIDAALCATLVVAAYRKARRELRSLPETAVIIDAALEEHYGGERFATALLAELDAGRGTLRWLSAGHHAPLLIRRGRQIKRLDAAPILPFGIGLGGFAEPPPVGEESLEPGDRLLFYTDGVIEARRGVEFFTEERLAEFVIRENASGQSAAEILRRLTEAILDHQNHELQDDATIMLVGWAGQRGAREARHRRGKHVPGDRRGRDAIL